MSVLIAIWTTLSTSISMRAYWMNNEVLKIVHVNFLATLQDAFLILVEGRSVEVHILVPLLFCEA